MPKLTYVSGGETHTVEFGDSCSIGRLAGNTVVLEHEEGASRRHCQILRIASGFELADLGSTNGTRVNGQPVKRHKLKHGDRIEIGKTALTFEDPSAAPAEEEVSLEEPAGAAPAAGPARAAGPAPSEQSCLVFAGGDKDGQKIPLDKPRITFGRNPKNTVPLADPNVSGFHAEIAREGGAYVLRDLGSTNGTLVDGEPVTETALQHGARIRMGATRFVFVDPTVSDFEKAMAAVDDLGSEWGLLRAEMDMTRVQQARRSQALAIGALVVVVLGGGVYVVTHPEAFSAARQPLAEVPGNAAADFSFEASQGARWASRDGTPTKVRPADPRQDGAAKQGSAFLAVSREGAGGQPAAAVSADPSAFVTVGPGSAVRFGAWARTSGGARAGVRLVWFDKAGGVERGASASRLVSASDWQEVQGAAVPPEGCRAARVELLNAAGGTAFFDDLFVVVGGAAPATATAEDGAVRVRASGDGQTTLARGDARLLVDGSVCGGAMHAESADEPGRRGARVGSQSVGDVQRAGGAVRVAGQAVDPATGEPADFAMSFAPSGGRFIDVEGTFAPDAAWVAVLPQEFVDAGIGVRTESDFRRVGEPRLVEKVREVSFGGERRFKVSAAEGAAPFRMALVRAGAGWEVAFGSADGKLKLRVDTDSQAQVAEIVQLRREYEEARQRRKLGTAVEKLQQLASAFPAGSADAVKFEEELGQLQAEGRRRLAALEVRLKGALDFRDAEDLRQSREQADVLAREFLPLEAGEKAKAASEAATKALEAARIAADERAAAPLVRKAEDFLRMNMPRLAKSFFEEVVQRYPGTEAEKKAREKLAGM